MAWNEPGNNNKDPWGGGNKRGDEGPPDLDEALKNLQKKIAGVFGGGKGGSGGPGAAGGGINKFIVTVLAVLALVVFIISGVGIVNEQEQAVVLRLGKYQQTKGPGIRWNPPLIDKVYTENVTRIRNWSSKEQMLTQDLNIVDVTVSVQYAINDARDYVLKVRSPEESLRQAANSALRHVVGSSGMHDVLTQGREQIAVDVQVRLQAYLDAYQTGIFVEKVNIEESTPPVEVQAAFDDVIKAREDEERYKNQAQSYANGVIPEARGHAQRVKEEAQAYKEQVIAEAQGESQRFEFLLAEYLKAPAVTRERLYLDSVQEVMSKSSKVLVDVEGGNNMLYLPLDKIVNRQGTAAAGLSASDGSDNMSSMNTSERDIIVNQVLEQLRREITSGTRTREGR